MADKEKWCPIEGWETHYEVSSFGNVRRIGQKYAKGCRILKGSVDFYGYKCVSLYTKEKKWSGAVHLLVAKAFIPNPSGKPIVTYKRGRKDSPRVSELEWGTHKEKHRNKKMGADNARAKEFKFLSPQGYVVTGRGITAFARANNLSEASMSCLHLGGQKKHKGWTKL